MKISSIRLALYCLLIILISCIAFFLVSNALEIMIFSGDLFYHSIQFWRVLTFPFIHISLSHLIQNIVAILVITFLAYEVDLGVREYLGSFFTASIFIALVAGLIVSHMAIAGLSMGIYAILGAVAIKGSNFIPKAIIIPLFTVSLFIEPLASSFDIAVIKSTIFHLLGFIFGMVFIITTKNIIIKKKVLAHAG